MSVKQRIRKSPKVGVDEFWFAPLEKDEAGSVPVYGQSEKVPGTVQVGFNSNAQQGTFYADNGVFETSAQLGDLTATVGLADIPPDIRAEWFGQDYKGGLLEEGQICPVEMGFAYRIKKSSGAYRYVWLYKGKASPPAESVDTQSGSVSYQTDSITINCSMLASTGNFRRMLDDDDPSLPAGVTPKLIADNWFTSPLWVPEPDV